MDRLRIRSGVCWWVFSISNLVNCYWFDFTSSRMLGRHPVPRDHKGREAETHCVPVNIPLRWSSYTDTNLMIERKSGTTPGYYSIWKELRAYKNYMLIGSELAGHGVQIFNMKKVSHGLNVLEVYWLLQIASCNQGIGRSCHIRRSKRRWEQILGREWFTSTRWNAQCAVRYFTEF